MVDIHKGKGDYIIGSHKSNNKCEICNKIISGMRGHPKHCKSRLCTLCYDSFKRMNLVWIKDKLNKKFEQGKASNQKDVLKIIEELKRKIRKVKTLNRVWKSWFCGILDDLKKRLEQK